MKTKLQETWMECSKKKYMLKKIEKHLKTGAFHQKEIKTEMSFKKKVTNIKDKQRKSYIYVDPCRRHHCRYWNLYFKTILFIEK